MVNAYLNFDGSCAEAFRHYEKVLGGTIEMLMTIGDSPVKDQVPSEHHGRVMHVRMRIGTDVLMGSDEQVGSYTSPRGMSVAVTVKEAAEGERIFNALSAGGKVTAPFSKTFFSPGFGMTVDRFGTPWMINTEPATAPA